MADLLQLQEDDANAVEGAVNAVEGAARAVNTVALGGADVGEEVDLLLGV